jgi:carboxyl-terminal processing protease
MQKETENTKDLKNKLDTDKKEPIKEMPVSQILTTKKEENKKYSVNNSDGTSYRSINGISTKKNYFWVVLLVVIIFSIGFSLGNKASEGDSISSRVSNIINPSTNSKNSLFGVGKGAPENVDFNIFWEAWKQMDDKFVDVKELDSQDRVYGAIKGMIAASGDPYSAYMDPEEAKEFNTDMEGSFEGIGAELGIKNKMLTVIAPLEGAPAEVAGLRPGDVIVKIFDEVTFEMTVDDAVKRIRGEKGTKVKLTVAREGADENLEIEITRGVIELESIKYEKKEGNIGYIRISKFLENTGGKFDKAISTAIIDDVDGLVIDVRNNPGGFLNVAVEMISTFIPKGEVVVWEKGRNDNKIPFRALNKSDKLLDLPVVVVMNGGSASASEILAGALKDVKGVKSIGEKSFGKGSVQQVQELSDKSSMRITIAKWLTPKGTSIHEVGLEPDIEVKMTNDDYTNKKDPQLDRALEELKKEIESK